MNALFLAIPEAFREYWWVYDVLLVAVIIISIFLILKLKKVTPFVSGLNTLKKAVRTLSRIPSAKKHLIKAKDIYSARNLLEYSEYYFRQVLETKEVYELNNSIKTLVDIQKKIDESDMNSPDFPETLQGVISELKELFSSLESCKNKY